MDLGVDYSQPNWSPDGNQIAFIAVSHVTSTNAPTSGNTLTLFVRNTDGTVKVVAGPFLTPFGGLQISYPNWSPDGMYIAFTGKDERANDHSIYLSPTTCLKALETPCSFFKLKFTNGQLIRPTDVLRGEVESWVNPSWSPDSKSLAFNCGDQICVSDIQGNSVKKFSAVDAGSPKWSPDGKYLAYRSTSQIMIIDLQTGEQAPLLSVGDPEDTVLVWIPNFEVHNLLIVPTPLPTGIPGNLLLLTQVCSSNSAHTYVWKITNSNAANVRFRLEIRDISTDILREQQQGIIPGIQNGKAGQKLVTTSAKDGNIKANLYIENSLQASQESTIISCPSSTATLTK